MNNFQNSLDELFNCTYGCENATQCEFNNFVEPNQYQMQQQQPGHQAPQQQSFPINDNNANLAQCINNFDDGVVPSNLCENGSYQQQYLMQNNYSGVNNNFYGANVSQNTQPFNGNNENYYYMEQSYTPCRGPRPWNFAECFGFYGDAPCQYANVSVDMEDFM
jgi:hypothetical protein